MTRRIVTLLVGIIVAAALAAAADEPPPDQPDAPLRLKKKKKADIGEPGKADDKKPVEKQPLEQKPEEKKDDKKAEDMPGAITKDGEPLDNDEDEKEVLERVARNMKAVEDRLVNKEINEGTRQLQDDIVKDLDALIKSAESPQGGESGDQAEEDMKQGGGEKNEQDKKGEKGKSAGKGAAKKSSRAQKGPGQQKGGKQKQKGTQSGTQQAMGQPKQGQGNQQPMGQDKDKGTQPGQNPSGGGNSKDKPGDPNRDADVYKDIWGHLPETLRAQMDAYSSREKYMDKHQDLIKQYYKTIAAQGRRKGD